MKVRSFSLILAQLYLSASAMADAVNSDPFLWLEEVDGKEPLSWVEKRNSETFARLGADPLYEEIYADTLNALNSKDKLPEIEIIGRHVYHLKKNADHPRGIYLRTSIENFKQGKNDWQTVVDIDAISARDEVKWVFHGLDCLAPSYEQCLMRLSPGGGDADELREFNARTLKFVADGFNLPEAKMYVEWIDQDHIFVSTDFGDDSKTESGYPRFTKIWQRGTSLEDAKTVHEVTKSSVNSYARRLSSESQTVDLLVEGLDYWNRRFHQWDGKNAHALRLPSSAVVEDVIENYLVVSLTEDWTSDSLNFKQGSVILVEPRSLWEKSDKVKAKLLRASTPDSIIEDVEVTKNGILVTVLNDVKSKIYRYQKLAGEWLSEAVELPKTGQLLIAATSNETGEFFARYEDFLTPPTLFGIDAALNTEKVLQQSATFDAERMVVQQRFAKSADGTRIPYFVVMKKDIKLDGKNPTHIFAYGGFRASLTPSYSGSYEPHNGAYGKAWLERGGVFVSANIRGGAEYGPAWHAAALLENRHKAFEDLEAVAEDLIAGKITSSQHLGIEGRSNGGLLVGATMIRRPDLYGAIVCGVPLLDMQRYNKLLAGASWMAEYGNPDTDDWEFIKQYSPYQLISAEADYPPVFFFTSTRDDRVHPGHARKMAAKMQAQGHNFEYFENTEGGHKGSATAEQTARRIATSFTHLWRNLK